ncbi:MAG: methylenetetrahydrofolate reductase C-terminal domain-containing protein [Anaerolineaceae bacterium]|nr:methylenetetrahydrofolate reductase C-terminal domain-containing protein [Anaerolineaceae bacterium]
MTQYLKEARRAPGSEWLKDHSALLERVYLMTQKVFFVLYPVGKRIAPKLTERVVIWGEKTFKGYLFNCQMCGQCILHSTGMTCPMNCPKNLRNGPCGGVRQNGHCEVIPERMCVWVQAWERSQGMNQYANEMRTIQPLVNHALKNSASWINAFEGLDHAKFPDT